MLMKIQYENAVIWQPCLFNNMASADVRSPCGEFAKHQGLIEEYPAACEALPQAEPAGNVLPNGSASQLGKDFICLLSPIISRSINPESWATA
jgi:hypothetical protein